MSWKFIEFFITCIILTICATALINIFSKSNRSCNGRKERDMFSPTTVNNYPNEDFVNNITSSSIPTTLPLGYLTQYESQDEWRENPTTWPVSLTPVSANYQIRREANGY